MRALLIELVGRERVEAFRSSAISPELLSWCDVAIGFQPSHVTKLSSMTDKPVASIVRWLPGTTRVADPHFDSSGRLHLVAVERITAAMAMLEQELVVGVRASSANLF